MKKCFALALVFFFVFLQGGKVMAEYDIQIEQRNGANTGWDTIHPITKAKNVKTVNGPDVEAVLNLKANKFYVDEQISNIGNASPKGVYATLVALQTAFPTGTTGIYVVTADGKWYYWNGSAWTAGGTYQSTGYADKSITTIKVDDNFVQQYKPNLFNLDIVDANKTSAFLELTRGMFGYSFEIDANLDYDKIIIYQMWKDTDNTVKVKLAYVKGTVVTVFPVVFGVQTLELNKIAKFDASGGIPYIKTKILMNWDSFLKFYNGTLSIPQQDYNSIYVINPTLIKKSATTTINEFSYFDLAYIKKQKLVCNKTNSTRTAKYTGLDIGATPTSMKCKAVFETGGNGGHAVLISNPGGLDQVGWITNKSLHVVFTDTELKFGLFDNGVLTIKYNHVYSTPCLKDNTTEYTFGWSVSGNTITFTLPDGTFTYTDSLIPSYMGRYCTLEHYCDGDRDTIGMPQFTYFEIGRSGNISIKDNFKRQNGAIGVNPHGLNYVQITN